MQILARKACTFSRLVLWCQCAASDEGAKHCTCAENNLQTGGLPEPAANCGTLPTLWQLRSKCRIVAILVRERKW